MHKTKYDEYVKTSYFVDLAKYSISERKYSGAKLNTEFCPYYVKIYPSDEMKGHFETNDPVVFTVVAIVSVPAFFYAELVVNSFACVCYTRNSRSFCLRPSFSLGTIFSTRHDKDASCHPHFNPMQLCQISFQRLCEIAFLDLKEIRKNRQWKRPNGACSHT